MIDQKNNKIDTIVGIFVVGGVSCLLLWYFDGFGPLLAMFKWTTATIFEAILSSVVSTITIAVGAVAIAMLGRYYLKKK